MVSTTGLSSQVTDPKPFREVILLAMGMGGGNGADASTSSSIVSHGLEIDPGTFITDVTDSLLERLSLTRSELLNAPLSRILAIADFEAVRNALDTVATGADGLSTVTASLQRRDGTTLPSLLTASGRQAPDGALAGFTVLVEFTTAAPELATSAVSVANDTVAPRQVDLAEAYRQVPVAAAIVDQSGTILDSTAAWNQLLGAASPGEPMRIHDVVTPGHATRLRANFAQLVSGETTELDTNLRLAGANRQLWCRLTARPFGHDHLYHFTAEDITSTRATERLLSANEALFRSLAETSPMGVARLGPDLIIDYTNPRWRRLTKQDAITTGIALTDVFAASDRDRVRNEIAARIEAGSEQSIRCRLRTTDADENSASPAWVNLRVAPLIEEGRGLIGHMAVIEDISNLVAAQESNAQLAGVLETTSDLVGMLDYRSRRVSYLNRAAINLFCPNGSTDIDLNDLYTDEALETIGTDIVPAVEKGDVWSGELSMRRPDGEIIQVVQTISGELDERGKIVKLSTLGRDVTDQLAAHSRLAYRATHDELTGLPNRSLLVDHMELAFARAAREQGTVALLFMDVDKFKYINDTFTHAAGDKLLQELAERLVSVIRPSDTVARLGGDEFVVLAEDIEEELDALRIARRIRQVVEERPFVFDNVPVDISLSIGIALSSEDARRDPATLLRESDAAMYRAKKGGRARTELYDEVLRERTERRKEMTEELAGALKRREMVAHFHPMIDLKTGAIVGAEALARWPHATRGILPARDFIELAVDAGLAGDVDKAVVSHAFAQAVGWYQQLGPTSPVLHLNASRHSLEMNSLTHLLNALLSAGTLPPSKLCIEISEALLNTGGPDLLPSLQQLRALGVRIAVDSVGASAMPLSELGLYPLDMLKVAPSVISRSLDPASQQLVRGICALARTLELHIAAEGVDQPELAQVMTALGLDAGQGLAFSEPITSDALNKLLGSAITR